MDVMRHLSFISTIAASIIFSCAVSQAQSCPGSLPSSTPPPGYPDANGACWSAAEEQQYINWVNCRRITVSGCPGPIVRPINAIKANRTSDNAGDCERKRRYHFNSEGISIARDELNAHVNHVLTTNNADDRRQCVVNTYYEWAKASGLEVDHSTNTDDQDQLVRVFHSSAFGSNYLKDPQISVRAAGQSVHSGTSNKDIQIRNWLGRVAAKVYSQAQVIENGTSAEKYGNTMTWRAYALTTLGFISQNRTYVSLARTVFDRAMNNVTGGLDPQEKGFMPSELARKSLAHNKTAYGLQALLGMTTMSRATNCQFLRTDTSRNRMAFVIRKLAEGKAIEHIYPNAVIDYFADQGVTVSYEEAKQRGRGYVEEIFHALKQTTMKDQLRATIIPYLQERGVGWDESRAPRHSEELGGPVDLLPSGQTYTLTNQDLINFCGT